MVGALCLGARPARAQNLGFQINRYEPTAAGEWSFLVDHPWYSSTRYFAAGLTLNYAHDPLVFGLSSVDGNFTQTQAIIAHQLLGHLDLAGSFLDRVTLSASLPVTLLERGQTAGGLSPVSGVVVGDPRFGVLVRLYGQPDRSPFSLSLGGLIWVPLRKFDDALPLQSSDSDVRVLPKLVAAGLAHRIRWSVTAGFLYRPDATLGAFMVPDGSSTGSAIQLGAAVSYADTERRFAVGPELLLSTGVTNGNAFKRDFTSLELLLGAHYNIASLVQLGLAGGLGVLREPGTPDARVLLRVAYAPIFKPAPPRVDSDHDGVYDPEDACPHEPGVATADPRTSGCPPPDRDHDGVLDAEDQCPDLAKGDHPDAARPGCPILDRDRDGVLDAQDQCPEVPQGDHPDPQRLGCPDKDSDSDGILDAQDQCPSLPQSEHPDPARQGCPDKDSDGDGVYDAHDKCVKVPAGAHPDPQKVGCPLPDRDGDSVIDAVDACPDRPGAPNPNPKKNGCPGLAEIKRGQIIIFKSVFFNNDQDVILKKSFPVLQAVANVLVAEPLITKLGIEGHTDNRGELDHNVDLSDRRARSVLRWLTEHGIAAARLNAKGYGPQRPITDNGTLYGRAKNRRVEFHILEPAALALPASPSPSPSPAPGKPAAGPPLPSVEPAPAGTEQGAPAGQATAPDQVKAGVPAAAPADAGASPGKKRRGKRLKSPAGEVPAADAAGASSGKPSKRHRSKKPK